jgi:hypothetical protein
MPNNKPTKKDEIQAELERIAALNGGILRPADVVDAARPVSSVLHSQFEWDDTEAAEQYRLWQARQVIRVTVEYCQQVGREIKVFVSLKDDRKQKGGGYRTMVNVMSDKQRRVILVNEALEELNRIQIKYSHLQELATVWKAITAAKTKRTRVRTRKAA